MAPNSQQRGFHLGGVHPLRLIANNDIGGVAFPLLQLFNQNIAAIPRPLLAPKEIMVRVITVCEKLNQSVIYVSDRVISVVLNISNISLELNRLTDFDFHIFSPRPSHSLADGYSRTKTSPCMHQETP